MNDTLLAGASPANSSAASELVRDSSMTTFQADVIDASRNQPVLVDFWAPWCGPCRQLGPAIEKVVKEAGGKVRLVKINIDENQELAAQMGVRSIPAVFAFSGGQPVDGFMGALPESEIQKFVTKILQASPAGEGQADSDMMAQIEQALNTAEQALAADDVDQALHIYRLVLEQMPEHAPALIGLTQAFIKNGALEQAEQTLDLVPEKDRSSIQYFAAQSALSLARQAGELGEMDTVLARIKSDPDDFQARMDLAVLHNAAGNREEATKELIEIIKRDRSWNEDAARTRLLEFFEAWGAADPASIAGRKLLSRTLFS